MKEFVLLADPSLTRNSLIFTGLTLRTLPAIFSVCFLPFPVQDAFATISPLNAAGPEVTLKIMLTLAPRGIGFGKRGLPLGTAVQPPGSERLRVKPSAGASETLVKTTNVSREL